jgi:predicted oxidoreductase
VNVVKTLHLSFSTASTRWEAISSTRKVSSVFTAQGNRRVLFLTFSLFRANNYQAEQSEEWIGEWMASRGPYRRDEIVLATKFTSGHKVFSDPSLQQSNFGTNNSKSLALSVEASLRKLQTLYIDLLYVQY